MQEAVLQNCFKMDGDAWSRPRVARIIERASGSAVFDFGWNMRRNKLFRRLVVLVVHTRTR